MSNLVQTILHLSDLHYHSRDSQGFKNLLVLNESLLPTVRPDAVVVSGDMTLGYNRRFFSQSREWEWSVYRRLWSLQSSVTWLDVPGNHDYTTKGVSYLRNFSSMGDRLPVYVRKISSSDSFCLLGVDLNYLPRPSFCSRNTQECLIGWVSMASLHRPSSETLNGR